MLDAGGNSPEIYMSKIIITGRPETRAPQVVKKQREKIINDFIASPRQVLPGLVRQEQGIQEILRGEVRALKSTEAQELFRTGGVEIADPEKAYLIHQALLVKAEIAAISSDRILERGIITSHGLLILSELVTELGIPLEELQTLLNRCLVQEPGKTP